MADFYTQCPNMLIFGLPNLSSNDRMVMLSLMYLAWGDEEPLQISMRDLAKFIHISPSVLCDSAKNEEEKQKQIEQGKFREGSLTRLTDYGYITVEEIGAKTYITVHLHKIWDDNAAFRKQNGVPNSNTIKSKGVRKSNTSVLESNSDAPQSVLNSNTTILNSNTNDLQNSSKSASSDPLRTNNKLLKERIKERTSTHSFSLSSDCLDKIRDLSQMYGDGDVNQHQEKAQRIYQQYDMGDGDFYDYLYHAQSASSKTKLMSDFFDKLQKMLDGNFNKHKAEEAQ